MKCRDLNIEVECAGCFHKGDICMTNLHYEYLCKANSSEEIKEFLRRLLISSIKLKYDYYDYAIIKAILARKFKNYTDYFDKLLLLV